MLVYRFEVDNTFDRFPVLAIRMSPGQDAVDDGP
jgi:hypothetical protein